MMKPLTFTLLVVASAGILGAEEEKKSGATKRWDPTYTDSKHVVEWNSREFKGFGLTRGRDQDGLKAMGSPKTRSPEMARRLSESKSWDEDASQLPWLKKDFQIREARIVQEAKLDWDKKRVETGMARGFDKEYPTRYSPLEKEKTNREFQGEYRQNRQLYTGPEAEAIRRDLQQAGDKLDLENIVDQHKLSIDKIKEMLNKP